jgi:hypothetical protein
LSYRLFELVPATMGLLRRSVSREQGDAPDHRRPGQVPPSASHRLAGRGLLWRRL